MWIYGKGREPRNVVDREYGLLIHWVVWVVKLGRLGGMLIMMSGWDRSLLAIGGLGEIGHSNSLCFFSHSNCGLREGEIMI